MKRFEITYKIELEKYFTQNENPIELDFIEKKIVFLEKSNTDAKKTILEIEKKFDIKKHFYNLNLLQKNQEENIQNPEELKQEYYKGQSLDRQRVKLSMQIKKNNSDIIDYDFKHKVLKSNQITFIQKLTLLDLDYSNTKANEKIVMLHQLGVLDFLRTKEPFDMSINSLATVLSGITGEKTSTLQPYINPIFSKEVSQKNNPLNKKSIQKVNQKLTNLGYHIE
ncbi:hypothetical protein [Polaribacter sp. IC063]|uniref:hypothetical protein n=1 Tax=Polaribacter sp. IC063 TaxID=57031 RepID=UPI0011BDBEAB|nr:hypothetical protein [Polaribacter sp. IC063]TXD50256.1 hypothetical protein ES043_16765 [Polaribacter sp. IC063]